MNKRKFFSLKHQKYILPDNKQFWDIAKDEALFRLAENKRMNCSCIEHLEEKEKLENFLRKLKRMPSVYDH